MDPKISSYIKIICLTLTLTALILCAYFFQKNSLKIISWIDALGWLAPILFVLFYCLATILFLPTMLLTLAGGALFGPIIGTVLNLLGATAGASIAFLITRHIIYDWFIKKRGRRLNQLISEAERKGWICIAFLRLFPIIPFNLVNYGLGLTGIPFSLYLTTTFIFLIPAEIIYTYFGYAGINVLSNPEHFYKSGGLLLTGLAILFLCIVRIIQRVRKQELKRR